MLGGTCGIQVLESPVSDVEEAGKCKVLINERGSVGLPRGWGVAG